MKNLKYFVVLVTASLILSSCATIVGGSKYWAKVQVPDHPTAKIKYGGAFKGHGEANFLARRTAANNFSIVVQKEGCEEQKFDFKKRKFRGGALVGTIVGWTFLFSIPGGVVPIPAGLVVDGASGAFWKPDISEKGVSKQDYKHYVYHIDYTGCENTAGDDVEFRIEDRVEDND